MTSHQNSSGSTGAANRATTAAGLPAGQLAALDQAVAAYRDACQAFASTPGTGARLRAAEADLRRAGHDEATGLVTLPVAAVHFSDVRADGARMIAVNGSLLGGETWVCWRGQSLPHGIETRTYDAWDLIQIRSQAQPDPGGRRPASQVAGNADSHSPYGPGRRGQPT